MNELVPRLRRHRATLVICYDVLAWVSAYLVFAWLRFDAVNGEVPWISVTAITLVTVGLYLAVASVLKMHQGRGRTASLEELILLGTVVLGTGAIVFAINLYPQWVPRSIPAVAALGALVAAGGGRAIWRRLCEIDDEKLESEGATRVLVIGAGEAGRELIGSMLRDPRTSGIRSGWSTTTATSGTCRVRGVPVLGHHRR